MQKLQEWMELVQSSVFSYQFAEANKNFIAGIEILARFVQRLPSEYVEYFNSIISELLTAQQNHDYLLLADIIEFKLKCFVDSLVEKNLLEDCS